MCSCVLPSCVFSELWEAQHAEVHRSTLEENTPEQSRASLTSRTAFQPPPAAPERPGISPNPPSYEDLMSHDEALLSTSSSSSAPTSAALLPRPQAVGSPGHPSPASLALGMGLGLGLGLGAGSSPTPAPPASTTTTTTPYLGNGDGSSSDSLDRQAAGQEDEEDEDDEDEDSSEYENLVSVAPLLPPISASMLAQGRAAALSPDGDVVRGSQTS